MSADASAANADPWARGRFRSTVTLRRPVLDPHHADQARAPLLLPDRLAATLRVIRFDRAGGRCECCGRPHGRRVVHLGDGRWWDGETASWRDGSGRRVRLTPGSVDILRRVRGTCVVLAAAHRDHDTANNAGPISPRSVSGAT